MPRNIIMLFAILLVWTPASGQEEGLNGIIEGTRQLEAKYRCEAGEAPSCFIAAGLDCAPPEDGSDSFICSSSNRAIYRVYKSNSDEWVVEVLSKLPNSLFQS